MSTWSHFFSRLVNTVLVNSRPEVSWLGMIDPCDRTKMTADGHQVVGQGARLMGRLNTSDPQGEV
jgi:hypothetical protein